MIVSKCKSCGKSIFYYPSRKKQFCSIQCRNNGYKMSKENLVKARERRIIRNKLFPISSEQARINLSKVKRPAGINHYNWKGGKKINSEGYRCIKCEEHPRAQNGYIPEHIIVMEAHLGRFFKKGETIHHKDGNKTNNSLNNLHLFDTTAEHTKFHWDNNMWREKSERRP